MKISHADPEVVTEVIELLEGEFGKEAPLTKTRAYVHKYLGSMTIFFLTVGKVRFSMIGYINDMLAAVPDPTSNSEACATAASDHFSFTVNNIAEKLDA